MSKRNMRMKSYRLIIFLIIAVTLIVPLFVKETYYLSILIFWGINAIAALGIDLLMSYAGQISLGHAAFMGIGAYGSSILSTKYGFNPWFSLFIGAVVTYLIAYIIAIPTLRLRGYYLAIATLGFGIITRVLLVYFHDFTGGVSGLANIPGLSIFGFALDKEVRYYYLIWVFVALSFITSRNIAYSSYGRAIKAIHSNEIRAGVRGINITLYKRRIFLYSACLAAISGVLYANYIHFITPFNFDLMQSIILVVMVILGGMGTLIGALLGSGIITVLPEILRAMPEGETIVYGLIIVLVMLFLPSGLVGGIRRLASRSLFQNQKNPE